MPTLLQIDTCRNNGSTGRIAESIAKLAMASGWECYLMHSARYAKQPSIMHSYQLGSKLDEYIHYAKSRVFDKLGLSSTENTKKAVEIIKQIHPDVVQLHTLHGYFINYQVLFEYLNQTNIPVVWTFHDCWAFTGHCFHFVEHNCEKWKTECNDCPEGGVVFDRTKANFRLKQSLFVANKRLTIVPCSYWMEGFVKDSFLKNKRIEVIHNGIDLKAFRQLATRSANNKFRIIAVSNVWLPYKGIYDIFKIREMLSDDYEITMVGLNEKQLKTLPLGIRGVVRTQNLQQLVELYNDSDVLINPTYADTFPTVNLEALACGVPVITYDTGGSPEAIDEKTGKVVEQGNINKLVEAIISLRENPLLSEDCRNRALAYYDENVQFNKYIKLYSKLIDCPTSNSNNK